VREVDGHRIVLQHVEERLRHTVLARIQDLHEHQLDDRRPEAFDGSFVDFVGDVCIIPPNSFALARTVSASDRATCSRSASARARTRAAASSSVTPFEPEWEGYVTLGFEYDAAPREDLEQGLRR
jgi:deoxycytidine triphosphate deaminase